MQVNHNFCLEAKWVIPVEPKIEASNSESVLNNYAIVIEKQLIKDILPIQAARTKYPNIPRKILEHHAVLPGFINSHSHSPMNLFKGYGDDLSLMTWLNDYIWPVENKFLSAEFAFDGAILAIAEMLSSGITCFNEMYFYTDSIAQAVIKTGIRAKIGTHVFDPPTAWANNIDEYLDHCQNILTNYKHDLITAAVCPHAPYTLSDNSFKKVINFAEKYNLQIGCHLHETVDEINQSLQQYSVRPIERLNKLGLFDQNLYAIHSVHLNQTELELLANKNIPVAHCPKSNLKLASGFCPIKKLLDHKINIALGTDSAASNNDLDMFTEMKTSSFVTKMLSNNPTIVPAHQAIAMATINGAKLMQLDQKIGSLTIGKEADIIAIDLSDYGSQPVYNPISSIVYTATRQQVSDVWVHGVHKVAGHKLLNIDRNYIQNIVDKWQERIINYKKK